MLIKKSGQKMPLGPSHVSKNLSKISKDISKQSGKSNKINIPKIFSNWVDIIGIDFHDKCIPFNITWSRQKKTSSSNKPSNKGNPNWGEAMPTRADQRKIKTAGKNTEEKPYDSIATLHILASSAIATRILYQEHLILERLSRILGYSSIKKIKIKHESGLDQSGYRYQTKKTLSTAEQSELEDMLKNINDQGIKDRLKSMGEKILLDKQS